MKKLLLLLLTAISALTHAGEFRNWKEHMPLIGPQQKHSSLPQQIPQQQTTKFYFTKDGQGLQKEFESGNKMVFIDTILTTMAIPAIFMKTEKGSMFNIPTVASGLLAYYSMGRFLKFLHEFGHFASYRLLLPDVRIKSFYVSILPTNGAAVGTDTSTKENLVNKWKVSKTQESKSELKSYLTKECVVGLAGPLMGIVASAACLHASSYCNNEYLRLVTKTMAITGLWGNFRNLIPAKGNDGDQIVTRLEIIKGLEQQS